MDVLRLGFAGLGEAATLVLPEIKQLPYIRVTAAADVRAPALERFESEFKGETFRTVEELCASRNVDAIYVATPHELHPEHTMLALESGKHVIVEKPMALCVADAEKMNQTAERCGVNAPAHLHLPIRIGPNHEVVVVPGIDHPQPADTRLTDERTHLTDGRVEALGVPAQQPCSVGAWCAAFGP